MSNSVSIVIPVYNGGELFRECLESITMQNINFCQMIVIDSSSSDGSGELAVNAGFDVNVICQAEFDHGGTRNKALDCIKTDFVVFMTQDAILQDNDSVAKLIDVFDNTDVDAVYGRQLPHDDANELTRYARSNSYTDISYITSLNDDYPKGFRKAFMSNSFAAYRVSSLKDVGGFPQKLILGEDSYVAAKILLNNRKVAYSSLASVKHSHNYTLIEEFKRYFDTGVFHASESWMKEQLGSVEGEGVRFALGQFVYLFKKGLIISAFFSVVSSSMKYLGYKLGNHYEKIPNDYRIKFSMYSGYFKS